MATVFLFRKWSLLRVFFFSNFNAIINCLGVFWKLKHLFPFPYLTAEIFRLPFFLMYRFWYDVFSYSFQSLFYLYCCSCRRTFLSFSVLCLYICFLKTTIPVSVLWEKIHFNIFFNKNRIYFLEQNFLNVFYK